MFLLDNTFQKVETEHPEFRLESLLHELSCAIPTDNGNKTRSIEYLCYYFCFLVELSERGKKMYTTLEQNAKETIRRFFVLGDWLQESFTLWKRFEELETELLHSSSSQSESSGQKSSALAECKCIVERFECVSHIKSQEAIGRCAKNRLIQLHNLLSLTVPGVIKEMTDEVMILQLEFCLSIV